MKGYIAGKPLLSTTDWPSNVSCAIFFAGCNLRCRFCFNTPILEFDKKFLIDLKVVYTEIDEQRFLIDGVIATGGEPTLQPDVLLALANWVHQNELRFGLMSNGTKPEIINQLIKARLLDYLAVDIKTIPQPKAYAKITQSKEEVFYQVQETVSLIKKTNIPHEFRTTLVPQLISQPEQIQQIVNWVGTENYVLQVFRATETVVDTHLQQYEFTPNQILKIREYAQKAGITVRF